MVIACKVSEMKQAALQNPLICSPVCEFSKNTNITAVFELDACEAEKDRVSGSVDERTSDRSASQLTDSHYDEDLCVRFVYWLCDVRVLRELSSRKIRFEWSMASRCGRDQDSGVLVLTFSLLFLRVAESVSVPSGEVENASRQISITGLHRFRIQARFDSIPSSSHRSVE